MHPSQIRPGHFTPRFEQALVYATRLHNSQSRKSTRIPYIAHLLSVAGLVIEWGGDEDQAIAALLHDSVERSKKNEISQWESFKCEVCG